MQKSADASRSPAPSELARGANTREALAAKTLKTLGQLSLQAGPLLAILDAPADDPDRVVAAIESSAALSARLLSVTNSAGVGLTRPITNVRRAVIHLGASRARVVALAYGLKILSENTGLPAETQHQLWVSSLRKASTARLAATVVDPDHAEEAYTLALLQDIGLAMLMAVDPMFYVHEMLPTDQMSWCDQETQRFGICHSQVGSRLLQDWNTPSKLSDGVFDHHQPPLREGADAIRRLPTFLASLLPHLAEPRTPREHEWLIALHAQFLASAYPTPDAFLQAASKAGAKLYKDIGAAATLSTSDVNRIVSTVSTDTETMVAQLCQLEHNLGQQKQTLSTLRFQAFTDPLTRLLNRRGFVHLAAKRLEMAAERNVPVCMVVVDMDDFKAVNDRFGHEAGDLVLRGLAKVLRTKLDRSDLIGRLGGDEFAALLMGLDEADARKAIERVSQSCRSARVRVTPGDAVTIHASVGAAFCPQCAGVKVDDLIAAADGSMYERKRNGKSGVCFAMYESPTG